MQSAQQQLDWSGGSCEAHNALHSLMGTTHFTAALRRQLHSLMGTTHFTAALRRQLHSLMGTTHFTAALRRQLTSKSAPSEMRSHTSCSLQWQAAMPQVRLQLLWVSQTSGEVTFLQLLYHLRCDLTLLVPLNGKPQCLKQGCSCCGYHILQGESSSCSF